MAIVAKINIDTGEAKHVNEPLTDYSQPPSKQSLLNGITVTTQAGNTFDGNETARGDMMAALVAGELLGETETYWKMANNERVLVTRDELLEALSLSIKEKGRIVGAIE